MPQPSHNYQPDFQPGAHAGSTPGKAVPSLAVGRHPVLRAVITTYTQLDCMVRGGYW